MRASNEQQRAALKSATGRAIRAAGGPGALSADTRVNGSMLSRYEAREGEGADKFVPVDVALDADLVAGAPIITGAMAMMLGYRLERLGGGLITDGGARVAINAADFMETARRHAHLTATFAAALQDGQLDAAERRELMSLIDTELAALAALAGRIGGA